MVRPLSAFERLSALGTGFDRVTPIMRKTGPKMLGSDAYVHAKDIHAYVDALPLIADVVEAAEELMTWPESQVPDGATLRAALTALHDALEEK